MMKFQLLIFIFILHLAPWSKANSPDGMDEFLQGFVSEVSNNKIDFFYAAPPIDLNSYVVPTADDIGGSTYLTDSDWVEERLKECLKGEKFIIRKAEVERSSDASLY